MKLRHIIALLFSAFSLSASCQKVKKRNKIIPIGTAEYHVLRSDKKIKHGKYKEIGFWPQVTLVSGNYSYDKRDGLWTEWYYSSNVLKCQGFYKQGKRVGTWNFYDEYKKDIIQKYNYDTKKLMMSKECNSNNIYEVYIDSNLIETKLDCPPSFLGGKNLLIKNLIQRFTFTFDSNKPKGKPLDISDKVSILINKDGSLSKINIKSTKSDTDLKTFLEKEFSSIKKEYEGKWLPAELNGKKINAYLNIILNTKIRPYK